MLAVEDKLQIGSHRDDIADPPAVFFDLLQILCLEIVAVEPQQADQRQNHRVVTKAQLDTGLVER